MPASAQPILEDGDILILDNSFDRGAILVVGRNGPSKGELTAFPGRYLSDLFYREGVIYVGARDPDAIERIDSTGNLLSPFTTSVNAIHYLSPGPNGGVLAVNGSREVYQFASDGSLIRFRPYDVLPAAEGGVELAEDACSVFWTTSTRLVQWDVCTDAPAIVIAYYSSSGVFQGLGLLPDGTFVVTRNSTRAILPIDTSGNIVREYVMFGSGLALDIDRTSFWTVSGSRLMRVDIATGAILTNVLWNSGGNALAVVGEPRAGFPAVGEPDIPALAPFMLALLASALMGIAAVRLRSILG